MKAGVENGKVSAINLDEDWDPEKYDKEMEAMFNDDYYEEGRGGGVDGGQRRRIR